MIDDILYFIDDEFFGKSFFVLVEVISWGVVTVLDFQVPYIGYFLQSDYILLNTIKAFVQNLVFFL